MIAWETDLVRLWDFSYQSQSMQEYQLTRYSHFINRVTADGEIGLIEYDQANGRNRSLRLYRWRKFTSMVIQSW